MSDTDKKLYGYAKLCSCLAAVILVALLAFQYFRTREHDVTPPTAGTKHAKVVASEEASAVVPPPHSKFIANTQPAATVETVETVEPAEPAEPTVVASSRQDRDGDGVVDEVDECPDSAAFTHKKKYFADTDGDGRGDPAMSTLACGQPTGFVDNSDDMCPRNQRKMVPGTCGCDCDFDDVDINEDRTPDCLEVEGADGIANRAKPGWTPNAEGWNSLKELRAEMTAISSELKRIKGAIRSSRSSSIQSGLPAFETVLTNALTQLNEVGARLYQMQKEQFVRSEDEANRLSAKGFVQSFWKVIVVDQVADAKVKASWTSIVQDLIEINNSISEKRANFDANAETYPERGTGIKRERPQEKARKEIEEAFNRAEKTVKTASKVLMDLDDLKRELKELAKRDS